jgi:hypothetical protein
VGQKEKARAIVAREYEFTQASNLSPEQVMEQALHAAAAAKRGLGAGVRHEGDGTGQAGSRSSTFTVRGPGGVVSIMTFVVVATPDDSATKVSLDVDSFLFQKGKYGMKPTINAKSTIKRYVDALKASL